MKVNFYNKEDIEDTDLKFAVVMARYKGKWIFVRHKDRDTWEIAGGHREENENIHDTASRELYEETGAVLFDLEYLCIYSVEKAEEEESFGALFYADVQEIGELPEFEMAELKFLENMPENLTYPLIQPFLYNKVLEVKDVE